MEQIANRGAHNLGQSTLDTAAETSSASNTASQAFSMNQIGAVCLPLLSESKKIIWVHSDQIDQQVDGAAELNKAFDRFPYLTRRQMTELAQSCSLHPDQVKVWFMKRRLQCGISWDRRDVVDVWRKFKTNSPGKNEQINLTKGNEKEDRRKMKLQKRKVKVSGERKAKEVREDQSAKEGGVILKKRKRMAVTDKLGKKRIKQESEESEGMMERAGKIEAMSDESKSEGQKCTEPEASRYVENKKKVKVDKRFTSIQEWPTRKSFVEPERPLEPLLIPQPPNQTSKASPPGANQTALLKDSPPSTRNIRKTSAKSQSQVDMMKAFFSHCQYPEPEQYDRLAEVIGISRRILVQWFGDMRYYMKRGRPWWMNQKTYKQAMANIKYQQYVNALAREQR
ncbi:homeobox and leucine zipper encoding b [Stegastes partitus]|uniref:Zinc fingers and homeoboxes protein 1 n=1 Tax=Stegastes partitus TaxID=144197 RepID=A0A9Y4JSJ5_9TELE|nr:PREDICTED: homeobox and leucine zipper protein Homez-like [Stegastes partitus]